MVRVVPDYDFSQLDLVIFSFVLAIIYMASMQN